MEAHAKLLLNSSSSTMFSVAEVSFLWPTGSSYLLFTSARPRDSLNLTEPGYEKQRFLFHPWPHPRYSKPFTMFKQCCVLLHAIQHCIVGTLPTTNMSVLGGTVGLPDKEGFCIIIQGDPSKVFNNTSLQQDFFSGR